MHLTEYELLFIHDKAVGTIPCLKACLKHQPDNSYAVRDIERLNRLRLKCRKELISRCGYHSDFFNAR
jgi:hypothetical protein